MEGVRQAGAAEGKSEGGRRRGRAHTPLPWHRPPLCGWALPVRQRAPAGELKTELAYRGFKGGKVHFPLGGRERFN